ncbi:MAG: hypothetical protein K2X60_13590 [Xanthobacteraceae bacterium]|nr:hypothetical protein [Xanthobacteraceae bacterium]
MKQKLGAGKFQICLPIIFSMLSCPALFAAENCKEPETGTKNIPAFSPPLSEVVIGAGRLQFYSAPNLNCAMTGVFVIPKDEVIAYTQSDDGWSSVTYSNPRTGDSVSGWVKSARLKETGTVGPKQ